MLLLLQHTQRSAVCTSQLPLASIDVGRWSGVDDASLPFGHQKYVNIFKQYAVSSTFQSSYRVHVFRTSVYSTPIFIFGASLLKFWYVEVGMLTESQFVG